MILICLIWAWKRWGPVVWPHSDVSGVQQTGLMTSVTTQPHSWT